MVKLSETKKGFVLLLPKRWVGGTQLWLAARFKRPSRYYEGLASTLTDMHWVAFAALMLSSSKVNNRLKRPMIVTTIRAEVHHTTYTVGDSAIG